MSEDGGGVGPASRFSSGHAIGCFALEKKYFRENSGLMVQFLRIVSGCFAQKPVSHWEQHVTGNIKR